MANWMLSHWLPSHVHGDVLITAVRRKHTMINMATKCDSITLGHVYIGICIYVLVLLLLLIIKIIIIPKISSNYYNKIII